jgi:hypothetical protein
LTDEPRVAHAIIYMDDGTRYNGAPHPVTDPLGLSEGGRWRARCSPAPRRGSGAQLCHAQSGALDSRIRAVHAGRGRRHLIHFSTSKIGVSPNEMTIEKGAEQ